MILVTPVIKIISNRYFFVKIEKTRLRITLMYANKTKG